MDNGFRKFKRKIRISAIVRALLMGVSLGVIAFAAMWLVAKLTNTAPSFTPSFVQYGIVGGIVAVVCSVVFVALMLPTDKRLAKRLDNKLQMHEKVQTMVAFRKDESDMAALQRENTQQLLMQTPTKKARNKRAWLTLLVPVLACGCMAAAIAVPVQGEQPEKPVDQSGWFLSVYDEQKLMSLIEYVQTSGMQEEPKTGIVSELQDLLADLKAIKKKVVMESRVVKSIGTIHDIAKPCHTHANIVGTLKASLSADVKTLGDKISALDDNTVKNYMEELLKKLNVENKAELAAILASDLQATLVKTGEDAEHPLQKALTDFAAELAAVKADYSELQMQELIKRGEDGIILAIKQPRVDVGVEKYVINRLMAIFNIPGNAIPEDILNAFDSGEISGENDDPNKGEDTDGEGPGGVGDGKMQYGSDDMIYDPEKEMQVVYGEVLTRYQNVILDFVTDGNIPSELEEMVTAYLAILSRPEEAEN